MEFARRRHAAALAAMLALAPAAMAQSRVESVLRAEDQRMEAVRSGRDVARFYDAGYRGITPLGQYETIDVGHDDLLISERVNYRNRC